jgi:hypothetical protein
MQNSSIEKVEAKSIGVSKHSRVRPDDAPVTNAPGPITVSTCPESLGDLISISTAPV